MFNVKLFGGESPGGQTVATTLAGIVLNLLPDIFGDVGASLGHGSFERQRLTAFGEQREGSSLAQQNAAIFCT